MPDLTINHSKAGFFSCCSVKLAKIVSYHNKYKRSPETINAANLFDWYKPEGTTESIVEEYFELNPSPLRYRNWIHFEHYYQFLSYKTFDLEPLQPFIKKYFAPSQQIREIVSDLEQKYSIDYAKTFTVFYRGNDKVTEIPLGSYDDFVKKAKDVQATNPGWRCLVQSDETEFIERMLQEFPDALVFRDEIRHIKRSSETTVDKIFKAQNFEYSKYFLAITLIMARSAHILCGTGNCSLWIALFRGNTVRFEQFLDSNWI